ncbi:TIGR03862 family flavoprotein [Achromobacter sp.]|uniref:TIGR03862 family flavoprotein n=1 Tax=Achromobacter sp. TaxID=134375 RepID=UPI003D03699C
MSTHPHPLDVAINLSGKRVAVIGGGPAGLMAAEGLAARGAQVDVYDAMPSVGRKFLMAGRGGLNLTHSEPAAPFLARYGERAAQIAPWLRELDANGLRLWAQQLGIETFVGSSGRVFPAEMKAAPLLRAWLARLRAAGVRFHMRHRWLGWPAAVAPSAAGLRFQAPDGGLARDADAVVLALGGGSWARLGSDGAWLPGLAAHGIATAPLRAANCGFEVGWSEHFRQRHAGQPVKSVTLRCVGAAGPGHARQGEFVVTESGIEGSLVYALSAGLRDRIEATGHAIALLDLAPGWSGEKVLAAVTHPRGARSMSSHLQSRLGLTGVKAGLLRECAGPEAFRDPAQLGRLIKALPLRLEHPRPIDEAISTAGGVRFEALTPGLMVRAAPGVFCAGEMLDWEAPTGGYLLTACMASGVVAAAGVAAFLAAR